MQVNQATDSAQSVNLDTKYFSLPHPDSTTDPGLTYVAGKPGLVLRKVKGRMKTSSTSTSTTATSTTRRSSYTEDPCDGGVLECGVKTLNRTGEGEGDEGTERRDCSLGL